MCPILATCVCTSLVCSVPGRVDVVPPTFVVSYTMMCRSCVFTPIEREQGEEKREANNCTVGCGGNVLHLDFLVN